MIISATPFRYERQMLAPLTDALPAQLGIAGREVVRTLREVPLGLIIPDLLIGHWPPTHTPGAYPSTTGIDAFVRALLEQAGSLGAEEIQRRLYLSDAAAAASLRRLARSRAIVPSASASANNREQPLAPWRVAEEARAAAVGIVAVEAKLARWQHAVRQAAEYLEFADRAVVVLDGNRVQESEALLADVRGARVGLMMQHGRILRTVVEPPIQAPPLTPSRVIALTKLTTERGGRAFRIQQPRSVTPAPCGSPEERIAAGCT